MSDFRPGRFQVLPPIVKNLIIINVLFAILQTVLGGRGIDLADYLGLHYWKSALFRPWQLVTHLFMHGSAFDLNATVLHLFSNMFALWMFGSVLENYLGPKRFLTFYFVCGLGAAFCHLAVLGYGYHTLEQGVAAFYNNPTADQFNRLLQQNDWNTGMALAPSNRIDLAKLNEAWQMNPGSSEYLSIARSELHHTLYGRADAVTGHYFHGLYDEATVGASGAVFGMLFAFGYLFPNTLLYFYFLVPIKAKWFVLFYGIFELYNGIRNSAGDNVAHFAHLGGMLFAFLLLRVWEHRRRGRRFY